MVQIFQDLLLFQRSNITFRFIQNMNASKSDLKSFFSNSVEAPLRNEEVFKKTFGVSYKIKKEYVREANLTRFLQTELRVVLDSLCKVAKKTEV